MIENSDDALKPLEFEKSTTQSIFSKMLGFMSSKLVEIFCDEPELISPTINGKNLFEYTINSLKQHINKLPSSNNLSEENKIP